MNNIFIVSDYHFDHKNILIYDKRPFSSIEEMNEIIINNHNEVVKKLDNVYFLGDFCFSDNWKYFRERLNGNFHLIKGNHDYHKNNKFLYELFSTVHEQRTIRINNQKIVLNHFPLYAWDCSHHGSFHCHGHEHGSLKDTYDNTGKILDVGINTNNYYPYHIDQIFEIMKNKSNNWNQLDNRRKK